MSANWPYEDNAKLRERMTVIETTVPALRNEIKQLGDNQAANRKWTEDKFEEVIKLIKAVPAAPVPQNDRQFVLTLIIGAIVTASFVLLLGYVLFGPARNVNGQPRAMGEAHTEYARHDAGDAGDDLLFRLVAGESQSDVGPGSDDLFGADPTVDHPYLCRAGAATVAAGVYCQKQPDYQRFLAACGAGVAGIHVARPSAGDSVTSQIWPEWAI